MAQQSSTDIELQVHNVPASEKPHNDGHGRRDVGDGAVCGRGWDTERERKLRARFPVLADLLRARFCVVLVASRTRELLFCT